jgi:hypothetical protein
MPGLDPGIHQIDEGGFLISDGLPGQARQCQVTVYAK